MLNYLPTELVIRCLEEVDHITPLLTCRLVCRQLHDIIDHTSIFQYRSLLVRHGFRDVVTKGAVPVLDRVIVLGKQIMAWRDPRWVSVHTQCGKPLDSHGGTYELQGGLFIGGRAGSDWFPNESQYTRGLYYTELPWRDWRTEGEPVHAPPEKENGWTIKDLGIDVHDFQVDPSQDLAILVQRIEAMPTGMVLLVHVRTMSDNSPHPESRCPVVTVPLPIAKAGHWMAVAGFTIQIMDDLVGLLSCWRDVGESEAPHELAVANSNFCLFNWQTGARHAFLEETGIDSLVFLSRDTVMFPRRVGDTARTACLDVYRFSRDNVVPPTPVRTSDFPLPSHGLQLLASFSLPSMPNELGTITTIVTRCEPSLSYRTTPDRRPPQMKSPPPTFRPMTSSRVVSLAFITLQPRTFPFERHFTFLLLAEDLLYLARLAYVTAGQAAAVRWKHWGPMSTRCLENRMASRWICYTYGTRFARVDFSGGVPEIVVLDFDREGVREYEEGAVTLVDSKEGNNVKVVKMASMIHGKETWTENILTHLPYRQCTRTVNDEEVTAVMIDSERIILSVQGDNDHSTRFKIYNV